MFEKSSEFDPLSVCDAPTARQLISTLSALAAALDSVGALLMVLSEARSPARRFALLAIATAAGAALLGHLTPARKNLLDDIEHGLEDFMQ